MKKNLTWTLVAIIGLGIIGGAYFYFIAPEDSVNSIYLVPKDAIYIVETEKPIKNWKTVSSNNLWTHLRKNSYFAYLTESANGLDSLVENNSFLFDLVGSRKLIVSAHMYKKDDYDFLYIVDLKKASKFTAIQTYLTKMAGDGFKVTQRKFMGYMITEFFDREANETLYIAFVGNQLVASYTHVLVENSISEFQDPKIGRDLKFIEIHREIDGEGMIRIYFQYDMLDEYLKCYSSESFPIIDQMSKSLSYTGLYGDLKKDGLVTMKGFTNVVDTTRSYYSAFLNSGKSKLKGYEIAPQRTASLIALGFDDFNTFYSHLDQYLQLDTASYTEYKSNIKKLEMLLNIDLEKRLFMDRR